MKTKRVYLDQGQVDAIREYMDKASKASAKGDPGVVLAQIALLRDGSAVMLVNFLPGKMFKKFCDATGKKAEVLIL